MSPDLRCAPVGRDGQESWVPLTKVTRRIRNVLSWHWMPGSKSWHNVSKRNSGEFQGDRTWSRRLLRQSRRADHPLLPPSSAPGSGLMTCLAFGGNWGRPRLSSAHPLPSAPSAGRFPRARPRELPSAKPCLGLPGSPACDTVCVFSLEREKRPSARKTNGHRGGKGGKD